MELKDGFDLVLGAAEKRGAADRAVAEERRIDLAAAKVAMADGEKVEGSTEVFGYFFNSYWCFLWALW